MREDRPGHDEQDKALRSVWPDGVRQNRTKRRAGRRTGDATGRDDHDEARHEAALAFPVDRRNHTFRCQAPSGRPSFDGVRKGCRDRYLCHAASILLRCLLRVR